MARVSNNEVCTSNPMTFRLFYTLGGVYTGPVYTSLSEGNLGRRIVGRDPKRTCTHRQREPVNTKAPNCGFEPRTFEL